MSVLAWDEYQPNVVYVRLVCPTCDADLDPDAEFEVLSAEHTTTLGPFVEESTARLLRALIELCGSEVERHDPSWQVRRQRLRGDK